MNYTRVVAVIGIFFVLLALSLAPLSWLAARKEQQPAATPTAEEQEAQCAQEGGCAIVTRAQIESALRSAYAKGRADEAAEHSVKCLPGPQS